MRHPRLFALALAGLASFGTSSAQSTLRDWWDGPGVSGSWFGLRDDLSERGITVSGKYLGTVYGVVDGGVSRGATYDEELKFDLKIDFAKLTGWTALDGLTAVGTVRWRDGENINKYAGASPAFNPSSYQSGKEWRLMPFYLSYTTPELFGIPKFLTISGGWENPYEFFARQEDAKFFRNNVIVSGKGISSNGIGWSSSYAAWGGTVKIAPCAWSYAQAGLYMAIPGEFDTANHGFGLAGAEPANRNGLYTVGELGVTPKIASLPGKYAIGGYYWGLENRSFFGSTYDGKFGFYAMGDQTLYREPSTPATPKERDGKTFKATVTQPPVSPSNQGLRWLGFVNFAPKYNNTLPFFFYTGLIYEGLIPGRDHDQLGVAFALGDYSYDAILANREEGVSTARTYEGVLEFDYRVQVNRWAFVQPFLQYVIRPGATDKVANATVIGLHFGVIF